MSIRQSQWVLSTSKSVELGIGPFGLGDGTLYLTNPAGIQVSFPYRSFGGGMGLGTPFSVTVTTKNTPTAGLIYMLDSFRGRELNSTDITGFCQVLEGSTIIVGAGEYLTVMLLGMKLKKVAAGIAVSRIKSMLLGGLYGVVSTAMDIVNMFSDDSSAAPDTSTANAMLVMAGDSRGAGFSAGAMRSIGYVSTGTTVSQL